MSELVKWAVPTKCMGWAVRATKWPYQNTIVSCGNRPEVWKFIQHYICKRSSKLSISNCSKHTRSSWEIQYSILTILKICALDFVTTLSSIRSSWFDLFLYIQVPNLDASESWEEKAHWLFSSSVRAVLGSYDVQFEQHLGPYDMQRVR